jgi:hypothetical protein
VAATTEAGAPVVFVADTDNHTLKRLDPGVPDRVVGR